MLCLSYMEHEPPTYLDYLGAPAKQQRVWVAQCTLGIAAALAADHVEAEAQEAPAGSSNST
jgi:hypothetical protein